MTVVLSFENVSKIFGALRVTDDLSFVVDKGEALGILGPNGAGKTTVFNLITGGLRPDRGRIAFKGEDITRFAPHRRCRAGIGRSYQVALPFEAMTVFENCSSARCTAAKSMRRAGPTISASTCSTAPDFSTRPTGSPAPRPCSTASASNSPGRLRPTRIAAARRNRRRPHQGEARAVMASPEVRRVYMGIGIRNADASNSQPRRALRPLSGSPSAKPAPFRKAWRTGGGDRRGTRRALINPGERPRQPAA